MRLNWKRWIAKEWMWFMCVVLGAGLFTIIILVLVEEPERNPAVAAALFFLILAAFFFLRITFWAIRQVRKKERRR